MRTAEVVVIGQASPTPRTPAGKAFANWFFEGNRGDTDLAYLTLDQFVQRLISSERATLYGRRMTGTEKRSSTAGSHAEDDLLVGRGVALA